MKQVIKITGLKKKYGNKQVLSNIDLEINKGEIKCLIGSSGSGKTTLLRCLSLLENFDEGWIIYDGTIKITKDSDIGKELLSAIVRKKKVKAFL